MRLPYLRDIRRSALSFGIGGLRLLPSGSDGEMLAGKHLDFDQSPCLCPREPLKAESVFENPMGLVSHEGLAVFADGKVIYGGQEIGEISSGEKQTAVIGGRIVIFPDKAVLDCNEKKLVPMEITEEYGPVAFESGALKTGTSETAFSPGDGVEISGCVNHLSNNKSLVIRAVEQDRLVFDSEAFEEGEEQLVTVKRRVPDLEVLCESGNRLWGCQGNTIYASKLGDPMNFFVYDGLSTDSYALEVGSGGGFTACSHYSSHVIFFKEDMVYKLYGTKPSNYQLMSAFIPGVKKGCEKSLVTFSEDMYYLGRDAVYRYSGGVPENISLKLGRLFWEKASAISLRGRYYISAENEGVYVFDPQSSAWLPYGAEEVCGLASFQGQGYLLDKEGCLYRMSGSTQEEEWSAEFCPFADTSFSNDCWVSLVLGAEIPDGGWISVETRRDKNSPWCRAALFAGGRSGLFTASIPPNRGCGLLLRLKGGGRCVIRSLERRYLRGSGR